MNHQIKVLVISLFIILLFSFVSFSQVVTINKDGNYIPSKKSSPNKDTVSTGKYLIISKNQKLPVYKTATNKLYVIRISKKTGKTYRSYLKLE